MTHNPFDDDQLEHILNNAPKLSDRRSKEEILNRLLADARLQDSVHLQAIQQPINDEITSQEQDNTEQTIKKAGRKWPIFMSVAAVFALTVLTGSMFMNSHDTKMDQANAPETSQYSTMQEDRAAKSSMHDNIMESNIVAEHSRIMSLRSSVYEDDLTDAVAFHIGLANRDKESVPMTYIIPNERVATDFGKKKPTTLQMYEKYAPQIDEEANGFTNYHPYKGELKEKGDQLVHVLPKQNDYDVAAKDSGEYVATIQDTFSDSEYKDIEYENLNGTESELSNEKEASNSMALTSSNHFNYYLYKDENGVEYLSPNSRRTFSTVTEALVDMRAKNDNAYVPVVPENITYTVKEVAEGVIVTFDEPLDLTTMDVIRATQLIEAMMLTAASFDQQVRLDNVIQESWEGFDLKNFLPKPVGANKRYMP
ncbi:RNA polymerase sigma factor SigX [Lysinibacillus sphaericus]|uniref:RNA polymerase subunit sigma n=1 Tax=Lysinibacillus sphaericus TaxID=1421 RepID=UPI0018CD7F47|nr:RNA polymerase subunit sigma [Lysinibacillus sphaericus]MBG9456574.1 RNA polymerase sigma factor SigX [Lysinibacillus sphaericus]MBG9479974.1 RNA polymerase sigma factor SigX [Lysinibacillus sphaericus]MBG9594722.1 RNA polymerase sigma factor SigX [Lysinibacillus sphaericus]